jgi:serine-type D-Ala-D-Ala carboxypeptidase
MNFFRTNFLMENAVKEGVFPGADLLVALGEAILWHTSYGNACLFPQKQPLLSNAVFDLASLTKPLATTIGIMALIEKGRISLDKPLAPARYPFIGEKTAGMTVRHLLAHSSGLPAYQPFYRKLVEEAGNRKMVLQSWIREEPLIARPGRHTEYSDLGFMALDWMFEEETGEDLDQWLKKHIYLPLGLTRTGFRPIDRNGAVNLERIAATEDCPWRKKVLRGEVHDENSYAVGGISGQAGLFGSAFDIFKILRALKRAFDRPRGSHLFNGRLVRLFWTRQTDPENTTRALGFDTPSETDSSAGRWFSRQSVGHLGFTGTSFWFDLRKDLMVILLTNRVHPTRDNQKIRAFRPRLHDQVYEEVGRLGKLLQ